MEKCIRQFVTILDIMLLKYIVNYKNILFCICILYKFQVRLLKVVFNFFWTSGLGRSVFVWFGFRAAYAGGIVGSRAFCFLQRVQLEDLVLFSLYFIFLNVGSSSFGYLYNLFVIWLYLKIRLQFISSVIILFCLQLGWFAINFFIYLVIVISFFEKKFLR